MAVASLRLSADIVLNTRKSLVGALASAGVTDQPPVQQQLDFLPADLSVAAMANGGDASASGSASLHSDITLDTVAGTLRLTGIGTTLGEATFGPSMMSLNQIGAGDARILELNFTLTGAPYTYALTGHISHNQESGQYNGDHQALLISSSSSTPIFLVTAGSSGGSESMPLAESGTLPPGTYRLFIKANGAASTNIEILHSKGNANVNFVFTLQPGGTPTPTPTPTPTIPPSQWDNPAGGSFHTATNWDPQMIPGPNDTALFGLQTVYTVDVGTATTERLEIRNGNVTFTNANYTVAALGLVPAGTLLDNAVLTLASGTLNGIHALIGKSAAARVNVNAGATLNYTGSLQVGGPGNGILDIADGGSVASGEGRVGTGIGGGTVTMTGVAAAWTSGNLAVGYSGGNGTLTISDGAGVTSGAGFVGLGSGTTGNVTIQGIGSDGVIASFWKLTDELTIGVDGTGAVEVLDLGGLDVLANTTVNGSLFIADGALSSHNSHAVTIGKTHDGEVTVVGFADGFPGRMNNVSDLTLGESALGHLSVQEGGFVQCTNATLGVGANGSASISGINQNPSELTVSSQLTVGKSALGELNVADGAQVSAQGVTVGSQFGGVGIVDVIGRSDAGPSYLSATENIILGLEGRGLLIIEEDAIVTCSAAALGVFAGGDGGATLGVDNAPGAPARWVVNGDMMLGGLGIGTIVLHNGANVAVSNTLFILTNGSIGGTGTYSAQTVQNGSGGGISAYTPQTVPNGGTVAPGAPLGTLFIEGNYTQTASGKLLMELAGSDPGQFDVLHVTGDSILAGAMEVRMHRNFLPATGQTFDLLQLDGNLSGDFSQITFPDLKPGFLFSAQTTNHLFKITALNNGVAANSLLNISTRTQVGTGDSLLIAGFIVQGNEPKKVILRGIGPSLEALPGRLTNPTLELRGSAGELIFSNDDWMDSPQRQEIIDSTIPPTNDLESAIVATLIPGAYTAILGGVNGVTGIGLVEVYDLAHDTSVNLVNISTRGRVQTGNDVMIAGFITTGTSEIIARALGPSLTSQGVAGALPDPTLEVVDANGATLQANDNWRDSQQTEIAATTIPPPDDLEAAAVLTVQSGSYTIIVRGANSTSGVGLVEVYKL